MDLFHVPASQVRFGQKPLVRRSFSVFMQKQGDDKDIALAKRRIYSVHKKMRRRHF
jgi:hypothetical protein